MHRPFVTTVKFENEKGGVIRLEYAVVAADTADAKAELERRFLDLEVERYTIEKIVEVTTLQARMLKPASALRDAAGLSRTDPISRGKRCLSSARRNLPNQ